MNETYKDILGYEGQYQVSDLGNVKSLPNSKRKSEKVLVPDLNKCAHTNYKRVTLSKNGETSKMSIHRLVAMMFIPNPEDKPFVNHIDNNGENNAVSNLEWCTHAENMLHAQKQGRLFEAQSKGGLQQSINRSNRVKAEIESLVGNTFGSLEVLGFNHDAFNKHHKYIVYCKCEECDSTAAIPYSSLVNGKVKSCKGCTIRKVNDQKTLETVNRLKGTVVRNWYITDEYKTVRPANVKRTDSSKATTRKGGRITFIKCVCNTCNFNTVTVKLRSLESNAYIPRCTVCDNDETLKNLQDEDIVESAGRPAAEL